MPTTQTEQETTPKASDQVLTPSSWRDKANKAVGIAIQQLKASSDDKKNFTDKLSKYENLYAGKLPKKLRVQFNVVLPVFSGMIDTMLAQLDDPIDLQFGETDPSDYFRVKKVQAAFNTIKNSSKPNDRWDLKSRWDKKLALMSGRGILKYYAESDPEYKSVLEVVDYNDFHCQPAGGGILENHRFAGQENVIRSKSDLEAGAKSGIYDAEAVEALIEKAEDKNYVTLVNDNQNAKLNRFRALGLDPDTNSYVGEMIFNLVMWVLHVDGVRKYLLFDPITKIPLRYTDLKEVYSSDMYPWKTWATHEDPKIFWSKSFADDLYPVADAIVALFNQELTNREKKNLGARAYDPTVFKEPAKLDAAQYRADALVPADTKGGAIKIADAIYRFDTPELSGTINLIDWISQTTGRDVGVVEANQGQVRGNTKKVGVLMQEMAAAQKRIGYRSQPYSECWNEVGMSFYQGLKDHMPASMAIKIMGPDGFEWDEITRADLDTTSDVDIQVVSSTAQRLQSKDKSDKKVKAIELISQDPTLAQVINPKKKAEVILREIGGLEDSDIQEMFDMQTYGSQETIALANMAIKDVIRGKDPEFNFDADTKFLQVIMDYGKKHRKKLGVKMFSKLMDYVQAHVETATVNMARGAQDLMRNNMMSKINSGQIPAGGGASAPTPSPVQTTPNAPTSTR